MGYSPESIRGHFGVVVHTNETITLFTPRGTTLPMDELGKPIILSAETVSKDVKALSLPLTGASGEIVGWGARSAAIRRETPETDYVVVVKPLDSLAELPVEDDPHMNQRGKNEIDQALQHHLHKSMCVLSDGIGGKPTLLKISREISGTPLAEYPPLLLLSDEVLVTNLIRLYDDVLNLAKNKGVLVDLWGSLGSSLIGRIKNNILPTSLRNVMVEYPTMRLPIVDVSAIPIYTRYDTASNKQKILLYARTVSLQVAKNFLNGWKKIISLRDRAFPEPDFNEARDSEFYCGFATSMEIIKKSKLNYRVVGSMAVSGLLNEKGVKYIPRAMRSDGTIRDVDVLCFAPEIEIQDLRERIMQHSLNHPDYPHISLFPIPGKPVKAWWGLVDLPTNRLDDNGRLIKFYKDRSVVFTPEEMQPVPVNVRGVNFDTIRPSAIAASYLVRTGIIKPEDLVKVRLLCSTYNVQIPSKYIDFARAVNRKYGLYQNLFVLRTFIDYWTNGSLVKFANRFKKLLPRA